VWFRIELVAQFKMADHVLLPSRCIKLS